MPTIVADLGGLAIYSWVFSAYLLSSTIAVPIYGKLSDIYGRRRMYVIAMIIFLAGSILSGNSQSMTELIVFRTIQGLGAGGLLPLAFIMVGEMFNFEQRARMQGLFSGVWGVSAIVGPLLGGFIVDNFSWSWVFYVNIIPGLLALGLVVWGWRDSVRNRVHAPKVDYAGTIVLTLGVVLLLLGMFELGTALGWALLALAVVFLLALCFIETRAPDPVIPLQLFKDRLFATACGHGMLAGWAMFGTTSFVPLFVQAVLGTDATPRRRNAHASASGLGIRQRHQQPSAVTHRLSHSGSVGHGAADGRHISTVTLHHEYQPSDDYAVCRHDGRRHGLLNYAILDRGAECCAQAGNGYGHIDAAIQSQPGWGYRRQCHGRCSQPISVGQLVGSRSTSGRGRAR